jgi:hypothetical protein
MALGERGMRKLNEYREEIVLTGLLQWPPQDSSAM